nr:hypothetical protein [Treponema socranskii]
MIKSDVRNIVIASYLEFARMFAEEVYVYRFDKNRIDMMHYILQTRLFGVCAFAHG